MQTNKNNIFSGNIEFLGAATSQNNLQKFSLPEIAFFGKSNVGKSSLINALCQRKKLARVSKNPGCTRQINFFSIANEFILADLPGYGYSKVSKEVANNWEKLILHYLDTRSNLLYIMLLIDSRRGLMENDLQIIDIILFYKRDFNIIFTKIDQMGAFDQESFKNQNLNLLRRYQYLPEVFFTSSRDGKIDELRKYTQHSVTKNHIYNQYYQAHLDADLIKHIIHRNSDLKNEVLVIKLAANIIEDDSLLLNFADNIKVITNSGAGVIIVHDYTNLVSSTLQLFGISQQTIGDLPLTDHKTSQIIEMVLSGYINKKIVSFLSNADCKAVGISGKDGNLIESRRSFVAQQSHDDLINIGFIGEPIEINHQILASFLNADLVTVISPVSSGLNRATHILDPDITASCIASELMAKHLIFLTPLGNISLEGNDLSKCSLQKLRTLHQQNLIDSNYSKIIQAARKALERNTKFAYISNANIEDATMLTIFANQRSTKIFL